MDMPDVTILTSYEVIESLLMARNGWHDSNVILECKEPAPTLVC